MSAPRTSEHITRLRRDLSKTGCYINLDDVRDLLASYDAAQDAIRSLHAQIKSGHAREGQALTPDEDISGVSMDSAEELTSILRAAKEGVIDNALQALGNCAKAADMIDALRAGVYASYRAARNYKDALTQEMRDGAKVMVEADDLRARAADPCKRQCSAKLYLANTVANKARIERERDYWRQKAQGSTSL
jgi:hypothetical protein